MKFKKHYIPLFLGIAMAAGIFVGAKLDFEDDGEQMFATNSKKDKLNRLIDYIDYEYVDDVNTDSIVDVTVNGILENLDPHSVYISQADYDDNADDMRGNFTGIGISFYMYKDTIAVIRAIDGGPAARAGLRGGDRILSADGKKLYGENFDRDSIPNYLKGEINSKVALQVYRRSEDKMIEVDVRRNEVPLISVDAAYKLDKNTGYIKLNRFAETSYDEFDAALQDLKEKGIESLVLDLRGNPGGYIDTAEKVVDDFLEDDALILITRNKSGDEEKSYATSRGSFEEGEIYVLIDENSASASEIVAGALQDNDKGVIVGRRSFGKGLVQREMALGDGSAVRLTIARYYTPTGRSIQRAYGDGNEAYFSDYQTRYDNGELLSADNIEIADSLQFTTPEGKIVYGGGGITPDVFVPKSTTRENETLEYIARSGSVNYFVFEYMDNHRAQFLNRTFEDFNKNFEVPLEAGEEFIKYVRALTGVRLNLDADSSALQRVLKASMAEQLFGPNEQEFILNETDPMIQKVLELTNKDNN